MTCLDSNILIYAFHKGSSLHEKAKNFLYACLADEGFAVSELSLVEFFQVLTDKRKIEKPLSSEACQQIVQSLYAHPKVNVLSLNSEIIQKALMTSANYGVVRYEIYDHILAITCQHYGIKNFATRNIKDFKKYDFLEVITPLN